MLSWLAFKTRKYNLIILFNYPVTFKMGLGDQNQDERVKLNESLLSCDLENGSKGIKTRVNV